MMLKIVLVAAITAPLLVGSPSKADPSVATPGFTAEKIQACEMRMKVSAAQWATVDNLWCDRNPLTSKCVFSLDTTDPLEAPYLVEDPTSASAFFEDGHRRLIILRRDRSGHILSLTVNDLGFDNLDAIPDLSGDDKQLLNTLTDYGTTHSCFSAEAVSQKWRDGGRMVLSNNARKTFCHIIRGRVGVRTTAVDAGGWVTGRC